jgi:hypothetical protein
MTESWWRLLAAFLLILAAAMLRGQDAPADRLLILKPDSQPLRYAPADPAAIPPERDPLRRYPIGVYPFGPYLVGRNPVARPIVFPQIVRAAGIIFSGKVTSIARGAQFTPASSFNVPASTAITFKVERAMRGISAGQSLTIHEWAGLWTTGEHYRVGERVLLFLYSPSKLGLTSPVAGGIGRFPINSKSQIVMTAQHAQIIRSDPILRGKMVTTYADFALAVRRLSQEE